MFRVFLWNEAVIRCPLLQLDAVKLRKLRPAFKEGGSVTAGNASSIRYHVYDCCICVNFMVSAFGNLCFCSEPECDMICVCVYIHISLTCIPYIVMQ